MTPTRATVEVIRHWLTRFGDTHYSLTLSDEERRGVLRCLDAVTAENKEWVACNERMTNVVLELTEERDRLRAALEMTPRELDAAATELHAAIEPDENLGQWVARSCLIVLRAHAGLGEREVG